MSFYVSSILAGNTHRRRNPIPSTSIPHRWFFKSDQAARNQPFWLMFVHSLRVGRIQLWEQSSSYVKAGILAIVRSLFFQGDSHDGCRAEQEPSRVPARRTGEV